MINIYNILDFFIKILVVINVIAFSFLASVVLAGFIGIKNLKLPEKIYSIQEEETDSKNKTYTNIKNIFLKENLFNLSEVQNNQQPHINLIGTLLFGNLKLAMIENNGKIIILKERENFNGYYILKIEKDRIKLKNDKDIIEIKIYSEKSTSQGNSIQNLPPLSSLQNETIKLSRTIVEKETADVGNLLKDVNIIPVVENGQTLGYKFAYINPDSIAYKYGFRAGDTIISVNGMPVKTAEDVFKIYNMLRNENLINVVIERDGQRRTINYEIQ
ncbi:hypothetical protein JCM14244_01670 [Venenivibrio stagnispumantis]|uniref:General secretion pathway protein C n=1 Tax=Venenivibrio stagnispumantis TaxID=407998 RepID=A0AA45WQ56_9AQUI|nr:PDZ domain-containing protein [Venenivibrio stagnispumantis]MCW4573354.1 PDZ domain-containing protein [Venenivibrio stagnispumantis]SMP24124.1 general secretion pathway protein C [Venenivibrio stagnispumantis]